MRIGIITFVKCDNYGAELQAYALQKKLNMLGYDAEVVNLEKQKKNLAGFQTMKKAILNRYKQYGIYKGCISVLNLIINKYLDKRALQNNTKQIIEKHELFVKFFNEYIKHSACYYTLKSIYTKELPYDVFIAGSDQIWNYMQTDFLDVYFLMFANRLSARKIAYAGSFSVPDIPIGLLSRYRELINNLDYISVREIDAKTIIKDCAGKDAEVVLDPTLMINKEEWIKYVSNTSYIIKQERFVLIYTLSGSHYIYSLAKNIAKRLNANVLNINNNYRRTTGDEGVIHIYDAGPREFITLFSKAVYVITDSFHGTAFSINFNIPFTTLLNPASNMNSRALSILEITKLKNRIIWDNGKKVFPESLVVDFTIANSIVEEEKKKSLCFLTNALK